jgi:hypothetical protein
MTARRQSTGAAGRGIVRAGEADIEVLSQVIADAFLPLAACQWLIPDQAARREIFPGYFRMYVEHAMADGLVHTTPGRDAAALWIPTGPQLPARPTGTTSTWQRSPARGWSGSSSLTPSWTIIT